MAKKDDYKYEITEELGELTPDVDIHQEWCKMVLKSLMNDEIDGIDVRLYNRQDKLMGKGIRLSIPEANALVDILLKNGYGSQAALEEAYNKRKELFE